MLLSGTLRRGLCTLKEPHEKTAAETGSVNELKDEQHAGDQEAKGDGMTQG